jgi:His-Xaa-Ser system protein HxsD
VDFAKRGFVSLIGWKLDDGHLAVPIDLSVFSSQAALRAAYKMTDRVFIVLQRDSTDTRKMWALFVGRMANTDVKPIVLEFQNELIDQQLRVQLEAQFHDVRTMIVAQAFAEGNLLGADDEHADYRTDPKDAGSRR